MGLSLKGIEKRRENVSYHSVSSLKCGSSLWQLKISTEHYEAGSAHHGWSALTLTPTCHLDSAYNKHHPPSAFQPAQLILLLAVHIFTAFQGIFMGSAVAHNKHGALRSHCTYRQLQFHRCHFPSLTKIHSWSTPRTRKCKNHDKIKISSPYYPRRG